jgi:hypothetical protein
MRRRDSGSPDEFWPCSAYLYPRPVYGVQINRKTGRPTDRQTGQIDMQTVKKYRHRQTDMHTNRQTYTHTDRQIQRQIHRQRRHADRETGRQADRHADRHNNRQVKIFPERATDEV